MNLTRNPFILAGAVLFLAIPIQLEAREKSTEDLFVETILSECAGNEIVRPVMTKIWNELLRLLPDVTEERIDQLYKERPPPAFGADQDKLELSCKNNVRLARIEKPGEFNGLMTAGVEFSLICECG